MRCGLSEAHEQGKGPAHEKRRGQDGCRDHGDAGGSQSGRGRCHAGQQPSHARRHRHGGGQLEGGKAPLRSRGVRGQPRQGQVSQREPGQEEPEHEGPAEKGGAQAQTRPARRKDLVRQGRSPGQGRAEEQGSRSP